MTTRGRRRGLRASTAAAHITQATNGTSTYARAA